MVDRRVTPVDLCCFLCSAPLEEMNIASPNGQGAMQLSNMRQHAGKPSGQFPRQWVTARPGKLPNKHACISCRVVNPQVCQNSQN
jgi:hypothetical protein